MVRRRDYLDHLAHVPLFSRCRREELRHVARRTTDVKVDAGEVLVREHHGGYEFFVIVDGHADVSRRGATVARLGPGEFFGELALLDRSLRNATVTALTPLEVIVLSQWDFEAVLDEAPRMARDLMAGMARRLRALDEAT